MSWTPLLDGAARAEVLDVCQGAASALPAALAPWCERYAKTELDVAVVLDHCDRAGLDAGDPAPHFERGVARLFEGELPPHVLRLVGHGLLDLAAPEIAELACAPLDAALETLLDVPRWEGSFDLVGGLVGLGGYALRRLPAPAGAQLAGHVLRHLEASARETALGIAWLTPPALLPPHAREGCPDGWLDLGAAHGLGGVLGFLAGCVEGGVEPARARRLLGGAVAFLRAAPRPRCAGRFPDAIVPEQPLRAAGRLAWCYGDLGLAVALLRAGRAAGEAAWEREALEVAGAAAARPLDGSGVIDTGLCHGAAGVAHLFNRLYQASGDPALAEAARRWIGHTLALRVPPHGLAGFAAPRTHEGWELDPTLLTGAPGTLLALLAAATDVEPDWDARFGMDLAPL